MGTSVGCRGISLTETQSSVANLVLDKQPSIELPWSATGLGFEEFRVIVLLDCCSTAVSSHYGHSGPE